MELVASAGTYEGRKRREGYTYVRVGRRKQLIMRPVAVHLTGVSGAIHTVLPTGCERNNN